MRIIAGMYRNRKLVAPEGMDQTRPTMDRVKEAMFNIVGNRILQAQVLDLFAGSGALGIEALSRGASLVVLNDLSKRAVRTIQRNLTPLQVEPTKVQVTQLAYQTFLQQWSGAPFDIVFLDPPYKTDWIQEILDHLVEQEILHAHGIVVVETDQPLKLQLPPSMDERHYHYGDKQLIILRRS